MIIETPYKANDTITFKTIGGEEVISRFVEEDNATLTVQKPMSVIATQQGAGMMPFAVTTNPESKLKINKNTVMFVHKTDGEMAKQYVTSTSNIQMA